MSSGQCHADRVKRVHDPPRVVLQLGIELAQYFPYAVRKPVLDNRFPNLAHQAELVGDVVHGEQVAGGGVAGAEEHVQVGAGVFLAGGARAALFHRPHVQCHLLAPQAQLSAGHQRGAEPGSSGRVDAVEHVAAQRRAHDQVSSVPDAHQVPGLVVGQPAR